MRGVHTFVFAATFAALAALTTAAYAQEATRT